MTGKTLSPSPQSILVISCVCRTVEWARDEMYSALEAFRKMEVEAAENIATSINVEADFPFLRGKLIF
jgi:hypothetical protein